jgi:uncharacterized membrane protein
VARRSRLDPRRAVTRIVLSGTAGVVAWLASSTLFPYPATALVGWDMASLVLLSLMWSVIVPATAKSTQSRAGAEDPGRTLVYVIVVLTSAVSLLAATMVVHQARTLPPDLSRAVLALCLATVALAWTLTHTAFAMRYARLYYRADSEGVGGMDLPGGVPPTYFDFAYVAFTIGMCFQVSDVCITSRQLRKAVLLHAVISFGYNSVILAFVLQLVFGMAS